MGHYVTLDYTQRIAASSLISVYIVEVKIGQTTFYVSTHKRKES